LKINQYIDIREGDSSLAFGMTRQCLCVMGKQRRFAYCFFLSIVSHRIASAFPFITYNTVIQSVSEESLNQLV